jgi:hypothetical protein
MNVNTSEVIAITTLVIFFIDRPSLGTRLSPFGSPSERQGLSAVVGAVSITKPSAAMQWTKRYFWLTLQVIDEK